MNSHIPLNFRQMECNVGTKVMQVLFQTFATIN